jgi:hypothetical protein
MMETKNHNSAKISFIKRTLIADVALLIIAGLTSLILNFNFGIILFALGLLVGGIGATLGGPSTIDPDNPANSPKYLNPRSFFSSWQPLQYLVDQSSYNMEHSVPAYDFENVMALAGLIAIILSIPFIAQIMFSK